MKKRMIFGAAVTAFVTTTAAAGIFKYLSDIAVRRIQPKMPMPVRRRVIRSQQDDVFSETIAAAKMNLKELPCDELTLKSSDGYNLAAVLYLAKEPKRVIVFMHGWRASWQKDFSINVPPLLDMGCTLVLVDQRCHGKSEGKYITYGVNERYDCLLWAKKIAKDFPDLPLYLWGVSMGATTVMLTANLDLPANVRGIIADCGYTSPEEIMLHLLKKNIPVGASFLTAVYREHFLRNFDFDIRSCSTLESLSKSRLPVLFFHGKDDDFVPIVMTKRNYGAAQGEKELVIIDKAVHGKCFFVDADTCFEKVTHFFAKYDES